MARWRFEYALFEALTRRAGIEKRPQLQEALERAGHPSNPEWLRRQLHVTVSLSDEFVRAIRTVAPELTGQDWLNIFWARFFPDDDPPRCA